MLDDSRPPDIVLASSSPRRRELLGRLGIDFTVDPGDVFERAPEAGEDPTHYAVHLARLKATFGAIRHPEAVVLGADTVVTLDGVILGKPADGGVALKMLTLLGGRKHQVITAVAVCHGSSCCSDAVTSHVCMKPTPAHELHSYVATGEPMDKAGAYAVQGLGGRLVESVSGCYNAVVGLPLCLASQLLAAHGLDVRLPDGVDPHVAPIPSKQP